MLNINISLQLEFCRSNSKKLKTSWTTVGVSSWLVTVLRLHTDVKFGMKGRNFNSKSIQYCLFQRRRQTVLTSIHCCRKSDTYSTYFKHISQQRITLQHYSAVTVWISPLECTKVLAHSCSLALAVTGRWCSGRQQQIKGRRCRTLENTNMAQHHKWSTANGRMSEHVSAMFRFV